MRDPKEEAKLGFISVILMTLGTFGILLVLKNIEPAFYQLDKTFSTIDVCVIVAFLSMQQSFEKDLSNYFKNKFVSFVLSALPFLTSWVAYAHFFK